MFLLSDIFPAFYQVGELDSGFQLIFIRKVNFSASYNKLEFQNFVQVLGTFPLLHDC